MVDKRWGILDEVEKLTEENAANFLSPSVYGQVKIKGKYIRDDQGKLVPVLVKVRSEVQPTSAGQHIRQEIRKPEKPGVLKRFPKWLHTLFYRKARSGF